MTELKPPVPWLYSAKLGMWRLRLRFTPLVYVIVESRALYEVKKRYGRGKVFCFDPVRSFDEAEALVLDNARYFNLANCGSWGPPQRGQLSYKQKRPEWLY